jgi:hypothetical protein
MLVDLGPRFNGIKTKEKTRGLTSIDQTSWCPSSNRTTLKIIPVHLDPRGKVEPTSICIYQNGWNIQWDTRYTWCWFEGELNTSKNEAGIWIITSSWQKSQNRLAKTRWHERAWLRIHEPLKSSNINEWLITAPRFSKIGYNGTFLPYGVSVFPRFWMLVSQEWPWIEYILYCIVCIVKAR